jgi:HK97 family phage major capsid protein
MTDEQLVDELRHVATVAFDERVAPLKAQIAALQQRSSRMPGAALDAPLPPLGARALSIAPGDGLTANTQFAEFLKSPMDRLSHLALHVRVEAKAAPPITGGPTVIPPTPVMLPRLGPPLPSLRVGDLLPRVMIDAGPSIAYTKETSFTPAADIVPEGQLKPATGTTYTNVTRDFVTIATRAKSSIQAVADLPALTPWLEQRLNYDVRLREEKYLLSDATAGMLPQASTLDPAYDPGTGATGLDTIAAAISELESLGYEPDGIVLNGVDIAKLRLQKNSFGGYLWASPDSEIGTSSMWGIPVVRSVNMPAGQFLVGAFSLSTILFMRQVLVLQIAFQNEDDFVRNLMTFRAEERAALAVLLPQGLITGSLPVSATAAAQHAPQHTNAKK